MNDCSHLEFTAAVAVHRLTSDDGVVRNFHAELRVTCKACEQPFHFIGVPAGLSWRHPTVDVCGTTLTAPIAPGEASPPTALRFEAPPRTLE